MEVPEVLRVAIARLEAEATRGGDSAVFAREVAELLVQAVAAIEEGSRDQKRPEGTSGVEYLVEKLGGVEVLTEHRLSGRSNALRCPKVFYDAIALVLEKAERPLGVEEIASAVEKAAGERPAEFQLRVPLRFWLSLETPLVVRMRARYRASDTIDFTVTTEKLWADLRVERSI